MFLIFHIVLQIPTSFVLPVFRSQQWFVEYKDAIEIIQRKRINSIHIQGFQKLICTISQNTLELLKKGRLKSTLMNI